MMTPLSDPHPLPTITAARITAAVHAARLLDVEGSTLGDARLSYALYPSDAIHPPEELSIGLQLLLACGLVRECDGSLFPTSDLQTLCQGEDAQACALMVYRVLALAESVPPNLATRDQLREAITELPMDPETREILLLEAGRKFADSDRHELGAIGEEYVVSAAKEELRALGRYDLAAEVRRVSEFADDLGYDVVAPGLRGRRRMEVKTTSRAPAALVPFFLTRNEIRWGLGDPGWTLVVCRVDADGSPSLIGHCRATALQTYLPRDPDAGGWVTCEVVVPEHLFEAGLPSAVDT